MCYHVGRATDEACIASAATSPSSPCTVKTKQNGAWVVADIIIGHLHGEEVQQRQPSSILAERGRRCWPAPGKQLDPGREHVGLGFRLRKGDEDQAGHEV